MRRILFQKTSNASNATPLERSTHPISNGLAIAAVGSLIFALGACITHPSESPNTTMNAVDAMNTMDRKPGTEGNSTDPYLWLEDSSNPETKKWVLQHNTPTTTRLESDPRFAQVSSEVRAIITASDRIPLPRLIGQTIRNFWQDENHRRGILRTTSLSEYSKTNPKWETVLDIDKLNQTEGKSWVYEGMNCLPPDFDRCLLSLSDGGRDETVVREFQMSTRSFVPNGFNLPAAKSSVAWIDANTVFVGTDFGPDSLTSSGYPRQVRIWKRGTPLKKARLIFTGNKSDVSVDASRDFHTNSKSMYISQSTSFFESKLFVYEPNKGKQARLRQLPIPETAIVAGTFQDKIILRLRKDWNVDDKVFRAGSVVAFPENATGAAGQPKSLSQRIETLWAPDERSAIQSIQLTKDSLILHILRNVRGELWRYKPENGAWSATKLPLPQDGTTEIMDSSPFHNQVFLTYESFTTPSTLFFDDGNPAHELVKMKSLPPRFDDKDIVTEQFEAVSRDGTKVPYFIIHHRSVALDGSNPTLLYGYGGFEINISPFYLDAIGKIWLNRGGIFVSSNIRGGGEFMVDPIV